MDTFGLCKVAVSQTVRGNVLAPRDNLSEELDSGRGKDLPSKCLSGDDGQARVQGLHHDTWITISPSYVGRPEVFWVG